MVAIVEQLAHDLPSFAPGLVAHPKVSIFRIYRDTRFSADKTPYKTNIAAHFSHKDLPKNGGAGLYFEVAPTGVWYGGGLYMPDAKQLLLIRQHLVAHHGRFKKIVTAKPFLREFGGVSGAALTRVPRGFVADHPAAEWLKLKQYLGGAERPAEFAITAGFYRALLKAFRALAPFIAFLNEPLLQAGARQTRPWGNDRW